MGIFPLILTTFIRIVPSKKILRNLQTKDYFVKWQKIEGFPFQVMEKKHHDFTFHFVLTFWHACTFNNIRFYDDHLFARFHHHTTHSSLSSSLSDISRVTDQQGKALIAWALGERGTWRAGPGGTLHSTGQLSSVRGKRMGRSLGDAIADGVCCVLLSSPDSTLGLVLVDGGGIIIRVVLFWSECSLCFHIYCNVTSRQRLYLELREEGWKLFCRCIWDQTGLKTHNKY